ncbi:MAG: cytochrome-c peroxidase, partial [Gammaproteobacteria bacterium]
APPDLSKLPSDASPLGTAIERAAWEALDAGTRESANRVFANMGKAIAAYERTLQYGPSRFDEYVEAVVGGKTSGSKALAESEIRGLRLFIGKAQCATCHNGPLLTDEHFHNTGVPPVLGRQPDRGRSEAIAKVREDEFNCLGSFSDAGPNDCEELRFMAAADPGTLGAFKTPGLRNVALRPPYMHAGQFATLEDVIDHYARSPVAAIGHSELSRPGEAHPERKPIQLTEAEVTELAAFLRALNGPIVDSRGNAGKLSD